MLESWTRVDEAGIDENLLESVDNDLSRTISDYVRIDLESFIDPLSYKQRQ